MEQAEERTFVERKESGAKAADVQRAKKEGKSIHFAYLMDLCHVKNAELAEHIQKRGESCTERTMSKMNSDTEPCSQKILGHDVQISWCDWRG